MVCGSGLLLGGGRFLGSGTPPASRRGRAACAGGVCAAFGCRGQGRTTESQPGGGLTESRPGGASLGGNWPDGASSGGVARQEAGGRHHSTGSGSGARPQPSGQGCDSGLVVPHSGYERSSAENIRVFRDILQQAGFVVTVRKTRGDDIDAACGQLAGQVKDKTRRQQKWQQIVIQQQG